MRGGTLLVGWQAEGEKRFCISEAKGNRKGKRIVKAYQLSGPCRVSSFPIRPVLY